jgi:hypothetical protein
VTYLQELVYVESGNLFWGDEVDSLSGINEFGKSLMHIHEWLHAEEGI